MFLIILRHFTAGNSITHFMKLRFLWYGLLEWVRDFFDSSTNDCSYCGMRDTIDYCGICRNCGGIQ